MSISASLGFKPRAFIKVTISLDEIIFDKALVLTSFPLVFLFFAELFSIYVFKILPLKGRTA